MKPARRKNQHQEVPATIPMDRLPPQNLEAEMGVLGALMRDNATLPSIRSFLRPEDFYRDAHQLVYRAMLSLHDKGKPCDWIALADELKRRGEFDRVGGDDAGADLLTAAPTLALASYHAEIIVEKARARGALEIANLTVARVYAGQQTTDEILIAAEAALLELKRRAISPEGSSSVPLSEIEPQELRWLWNHRIPLGKLTAIAGQPGIGKTFISQDMAARVTTGTPFPDTPDVPNPAGSVVMISSEDDLADTVVPRLIKLGADLTKIRTLAAPVLYRWTLDNLVPLERAIDDAGDCRLVIIDPPAAHLGRADENKNAEVRAILTPMTEMAARRGVAVVLVTHVGKSKAEGAATRVLGSVAWINTPRAAWLVKKDDANKSRRLMLPIKGNLAPNMTGIAYQINPETSRVEWESQLIETDADEACRAETEAKRGPKPLATTKFAEWLFEQMKGSPPVPVMALVNRARAAGFMKSPTERNQKPSISSLYDARDLIPTIKPGWQVEQLDLIDGGRSLKHWRLFNSESDDDDEPVF